MTDLGPREVVAIDGPSGTGKSTVSRGVARRLGWRYLDTGAMYRAVTWAVLRYDVPPAEAAVRYPISIGTDPSAEDVRVGAEHVEPAIRSAEVTAAVSAVSAVPAVRSVLVAAQRALIGDGRIVVEGRDIGTVVVPDARLKVYLTARPAERAVRRARQDRVGDATAVAAVAGQLRRRDDVDSNRVASPLRPALHAVVIDTTTMSQDEVIEHVVSLARLAVS